MATILVVDDELGIRALLSEILADEGHTVEVAENAAQARESRQRFRPDLVLLDICGQPDALYWLAYAHVVAGTAQRNHRVLMHSAQGAEAKPQSALVLGRSTARR